MRATFLALLLVLPVAASAQPGEPRLVEVRLSNFDFTPGTIRLRAGEPVVLRLVNASGGGHNFAAPDFFAAATVRSGAASIGRGAVEVPKRETVEIVLVPARGSYRLRCTHTLHTTFGMRGRIVVE